MAILSDRTIKRLISQGKLVQGVGHEHALHCAFHMPPGKIYVPASQETIDWTDANEGRDFYAVQPGQLVWVRTMGHVKMPNDICAFWWQTNSLSRKGLMLVNMSMVEPGYQGLLSCLFVNFGKDVAVIHRNMPVAKLVFTRLDQDAENPYGKNLSDDVYDANLVDLMAIGPHSFLQIAQLSDQFEKAARNFEEEKTEAYLKIKESLNDAILAQQKLSDDLRKKFAESVEQDAAAVFKKTFGWAVPIVIVLTLVWSGASAIKAYFSSDLETQVHAAVSEELARRATYPMVMKEESSSGSNKGPVSIKKTR